MRDAFLTVLLNYMRPQCTHSEYRMSYDASVVEETIQKEILPSRFSIPWIDLFYGPFTSVSSVTLSHQVMNRIVKIKKSIESIERHVTSDTDYLAIVFKVNTLALGGLWSACILLKRNPSTVEN